MNPYWQNVVSQQFGNGGMHRAFFHYFGIMRTYGDALFDYVIATREDF